MAGEGDNKRATALCRRPRAGLSLAIAVVALLLLAAGGAAVVFRRSRPTSPPSHPLAKASVPCRSSAAGPSGPVPRSLGSWRYQGTLAGTFFGFASGPNGALDALQACGAEESSLRVVAISPEGKLEASSRRFERAAPLASSTAWSGHRLYLGTGTLSLAKTVASEPYRLELYVLNRHLQVMRQMPLGRGDDIVLVPGPHGSVVASTGTSLIRILPNGDKVPLRYSSTAFVQHVVPITSGTALLSSFRPAALAPMSSTNLSVLNLVSGTIEAAKALPSGDEVASLAWHGRDGVVVVDTGGTDVLEETKSLEPLELDSLKRETALVPISLLSSRSHLVVAGLSALSCLSFSGAVVHSTKPEGSRQLPTALGQIGRRSFAITPSGIGRLFLPGGC